MPRLRHVDCAGRGYARRRSGRGFAFLDERGEPIRDAATVARIKALVIPPAWTDVWICPAANGHLQAVGTDAAGRRQYLYHPQWREAQDRQKFEEMTLFARRLPAARRRLARLLRGDDPCRERILACAVSLLDEGLFRIGGEEYADTHGSHGLATLERRHVTVGARGAITFEYEGKSGQHQVQAIRDPRLARVLEQLLQSRRRSPRLLAYRAGRRWVDVRSDDVNAFLKEVVGPEFSAKNFRTWHATVLAAIALAAEDEARSDRARKRAVAAAVQAVAGSLGNTPAVSRASYIDPRVVDRFLAGQTIPRRLAETEVRPLSGARLVEVERAVLELLAGSAG